MKRRRPIAMLSDGAFAVCGYYSTRKIILQGVLFRNLHAVDKYGPHLGHDLEGAAVRDDDVGVLAHLQRADFLLFKVTFYLDFSEVCK